MYKKCSKYEISFAGGNSTYQAQASIVSGQENHLTPFSKEVNRPRAGLYCKYNPNMHSSKVNYYLSKKSFGELDQLGFEIRCREEWVIAIMMGMQNPLPLLTMVPMPIYF